MVIKIASSVPGHSQRCIRLPWCQPTHSLTPPHCPCLSLFLYCCVRIGSAGCIGRACRQFACSIHKDAHTHTNSHGITLDVTVAYYGARILQLQLPSSSSLSSWSSSASSLLLLWHPSTLEMVAVSTNRLSGNDRCSCNNAVAICKLTQAAKIF